MSEPTQNQARKLVAEGTVKLYELDFGPALGLAAGDEANIRRFVADTELDGTPILLNGVQYDPLPLREEHYERGGAGAPARPRIDVFNGDGVISSVMNAIGDIAGAIVRRTRIFPKNLDGGSDPDPLAAYESEVYRIERVVEESRYSVGLELSALMDIEVSLPLRVASATICPFRYLDPETCGWVPVPGRFFDELDNLLPDGDPDDNCGLRVNSCKVRFEPDPLRFGGLAGIDKIG